MISWILTTSISRALADGKLDIYFASVKPVRAMLNHAWAVRRALGPSQFSYFDGDDIMDLDNLHF